MAIKGQRTPAQHATAPAAIQNHGPAANDFHVNTPPVASDPIQRINDEIVQGSCYIRNDGSAIYAHDENALVRIYETDAERKAEERLENGGLTNDQVECRAFAYELTREIAQENFISFSTPPDTYRGNTFTGHDGKTYTEIKGMDGKNIYLDDGHSCVNPDATRLGNTIAGRAARVEQLVAMGPAMNDDLISDDTQFNINNKINADGSISQRRSEDRDFRQTMARVDAEAAVGLQINGIERITASVVSQSISAAPSVITSDVSAETSFNAVAAGKSIIMRPDYVAPESLLAKPPAANHDYFISMANGPSF
jgi:hypothetical protein